MIYIVEDDTGNRELVLYMLEASGMPAKGFPCSEPFWEAMQTELPDLILLDIMLPDEDGLTILKKLRADRNTAKIPVIMLTAKGSEYDKVMGLDSGADDYIAKPYGMMELIARMKAVLRRTQPTETQVLSWGDLTIHLSNHTVRVKDKEVTLTLKEFEILHCLLSAPGKVYTRDELIDHAWGYAFTGETRTVDVHIRTLRQKLGEAGDYIETIRGVGYKLRNLS